MRNNINTELHLAVNSGKLKDEEKFWFNSFADGISFSAFPYDRISNQENPEINDAQLKDINFNIPSNVTESIIRIAKNNDSAIEVIFITAINLLIYSYSNDIDISIAIPSKKHALDSKLVNSVLVIKNKINTQASFKENLIKVKNTVQDSIQYSNYPIELLIKKLNLVENSKTFPFTDILFSFNNLHNATETSNYNFNTKLYLEKVENQLKFTIKYNSDLYNESTILEFYKTFEKILDSSIHDLDIPLNQYNLLTDDDKKQILEDFNRTQTANNFPASIIHLFEDQVKLNRKEVAIYSENETLTFEELNSKADTLAKHLISMGVKHGEIIAVLTDRSIEFVTAIIGILKAGAAFLPLSPETPTNRVQYIVNDSKLSIVLSETKYKEKVNILNRPVIFLDENIVNESDITLNSNYKSGEICYVIYTSGSTGKPKGVIINHTSLINYVDFAKDHYAKENGISFPLFTSISFDLTITSIFTPLASGNSIVIFRNDYSENDLKSFFLNPKLGVIKLTPAHLKFLLKDNSTKLKISESENFHLKRLIVGGEKLDVTLAKDIHNLFKGQVDIFNEYGPTEATVGCMIHKYEVDNDGASGVFIGSPIQNLGIYLLNNELMPTLIGSVGELFISGDGLARGYINNPELTSESFIENQRIGKKIYKTGDLGRFVRTNKGVILDYLGRKDGQIKLNGHRIELSEIERVIKGYKLENKIEREQLNISFETNKKQAEEKVLCKNCLLSQDHRGTIFDDNGVCNSCNHFEQNKEQINKYFKNDNDLNNLFENIKKQSTGKYDCLLLFSGGKDSTYTLFRLKELGLRVLTFTFDNGFISELAIENITNITKKLNTDNIIIKHDKINQVFVESLISNKDVCSGCWNAINSLGIKYALENDINYLISGLSRGQIIEMRLEGLFNAGIFNEEEITKSLLTFRKAFHSINNRFFRQLGLSFEDSEIEKINFIDYFRYDPVETNEIREYLEEKKWKQPKDTGFCSSNCLINDTGNMVHVIENGYHFYAAQHSWDYRMGIISREKALKELDFTVDLENSKKILENIGYFSHSDITNAVVMLKEENSQPYLCTFIESSNVVSYEKLREYLQIHLPEYMIPSKFYIYESFPLTIRGKVDKKALQENANNELKPIRTYSPPRNSTEELLVNICSDEFSINEIGIEDNFFDFGATSFSIVQANNRLNTELNLDISVITWFENPKIIMLSQYISDNANVSLEAPENTEIDYESRSELLDNSLNIFNNLTNN